MDLRFNIKYFFVIFLALSIVLFSCGKSNVAPGNEEPEPEEELVDDGVIRILAIGNSFSEDALENYLYELANAEDVEIVIGNLYIGGASLQQHWQNTAVNNTSYSYRKIDKNGNKTTRGQTAMNIALTDEDWDFVSFQQASPLSGQYSTYEAHLPLLFDYVQQRVKKKDARYILHQTWSYAQNSTHDGFANYGNDQLSMYHAIMDAVGRAKDLVDISVVVPSGTAIQNGRTSSIGDNFTRDGYHLHLGVGRFTAACTWFSMLTGKDVRTNSFVPDNISNCEVEIAKQAAYLAVKQPYEITTMIDYQCPSGDN